MAFTHGSKAKFFLDNLAGALQDLSAYITNVEASYQRAMHKTTTLGKTAETYLPGLNDGTINLSGKWDPVVEAHFTALLTNSASSTFQDGPQGNTVGQRRASGECFLMSYSGPQQVDDVVGWSAQLQITDAVTFDTW
jgi:hypothetical protein